MSDSRPVVVRRAPDLFAGAVWCAVLVLAAVELVARFWLDLI